jgi:hypothetical protein
MFISGVQTYLCTESTLHFLVICKKNTEIHAVSGKPVIERSHYKNKHEQHTLSIFLKKCNINRRHFH